MYTPLKNDDRELPRLLQETLEEARTFLSTLDLRPPHLSFQPGLSPGVPEYGRGAAAALEQFRRRFAPHLSAGAGSRYYGHGTGDATPAALIGDWLTSAFDQPGAVGAAGTLEQEALEMARQLLQLPDDYQGCFVSGVTMSALVGLATGRQWLARQHGLDAANQGLYGMPPLKVLSANPHAGIYQAMTMLGLGRQHLLCLPARPGREAMDTAALEAYLQEHPGEPVIVVGNAGTANTGDFDDLRRIARLKGKYDFWLHVDGAFGGHAACSPAYRFLVNGLEWADSITIDAQRWLHVPDDTALHFCRHPHLQAAIFQEFDPGFNNGEVAGSDLLFTNPPGLSRRWRGLAAWLTLTAYGREGYREIVDRHCRLAAWLGERIDRSSHFDLLAKVRFNVVCFAVRGLETIDEVNAFLGRLREEHRFFATAIRYQGRPAIRIALGNWRTGAREIADCWEGLQALVQVGPAVIA